MPHRQQSATAAGNAAETDRGDGKGDAGAEHERHDRRCRLTSARWRKRTPRRRRRSPQSPTARPTPKRSATVTGPLRPASQKHIGTRTNVLAQGETGRDADGPERQPDQYRYDADGRTDHAKLEQLGSPVLGDKQQPRGDGHRHRPGREPSQATIGAESSAIAPPAAGQRSSPPSRPSAPPAVRSPSPAFPTASHRRAGSARDRRAAGSAPACRRYRLAS